MGSGSSVSNQPASIHQFNSPYIDSRGHNTNNSYQGRRNTTTVVPNYSDGRRLSATTSQLPNQDVQRRRRSQRMPRPLPTMPSTSQSTLPPLRMDRWDTSRDMVYSRILSAEEFLGRILEIDAYLHSVSQADHRDSQLTQITEVMGLRAHLYSELVRIQMMLSENDPQLKCIAEFEISNEAVVKKLRELQIESNRLTRDTATDIDDHRTIVGGTDVETETSDHRTKTSSSTNTSQFSQNNISTQSIETDTDDQFLARGTRKRVFVDAGIQGDINDFDDNDLSQLSEDGLADKHRKEEGEMAEKYARFLTDGQRMSGDEVNDLLSAHAKSVQLLKMKQDEERERLRQRLEMKRKQFLGDLDEEEGTSNDVEISRNSSDSGLGRLSRNEYSEDPSTSTNHSTDDDNTSKLLLDNQEKQRQLQLKRMQEKEKLNDKLQQKRLMSERQPVERPTENDPNLDNFVQHLETLRLQGELTEDAVAEIANKYLHAPPARPRRASALPPVDNEATKDSASLLVLEHQEKQRQIQTKRQQEKEKLNEKLKQKLQRTEVLKAENGEDEFLDF